MHARIRLQRHRPRHIRPDAQVGKNLALLTGFDQAVGQALQVHYTVLDAVGQEVAQGQVDGEPVALPPAIIGSGWGWCLN